MSQQMGTMAKLFNPSVISSFAKNTFSLKKRKVREPNGEKDAVWYDESFKTTAEWKLHYSSSSYYFLWTVIADRIKRNRDQSILEIGCGSGQLACMLRDIGLLNYHGFDFSPKRIVQAIKVCPELNFSEEDAYKTTLFSSFDYTTVICTEFLEHVEKDIEVIKKIKPGTRFYGTVPNFPFTSHVRHFTNEREVFERYKPCFSELEVNAVLANNKGKTFYLLEGITN